MAKKSSKLAKLLRKELADTASIGRQQLDPVTGLMSSFTKGELLVKELIEKALDGKEWANLLVFGYSEGKPGQQAGADGAERNTEDRIEDATRQHLNDLANSFAGKPAISPPAQLTPNTAPVQPPVGKPVQPATQPAPATNPSAPARRLLGLPSNRPPRAQGATGQPAIPPSP